MRKRLVHEAQGYSVVFLHGTRSFALAERTGQPVAGRAFFTRYREAVAFKRALAIHTMKTKVVPVHVRMEEEGGVPHA